MARRAAATESDKIKMTTIKGGVTTSTGSDIVFTNPTAKVVMTISSAGELTIGDHVTPAELGQMLVQEFGRSYGSALRAAEERDNRERSSSRLTTRHC